MKIEVLDHVIMRNPKHSSLREWVTSTLKVNETKQTLVA